MHFLCFVRKPFLTPWETAQKIFSHPYTLFVFFVYDTPKHYKIGENKQKKSWTDFQLNLGQIFSSRNAKSWTDFQLYSIYIYIVESKVGRRFALFGQTLVQDFFSFSFCFSQIFFFVQGEWDFQTKGRNWQCSWVKNWSNYVAQHPWTSFWLLLGPVFDSGKLTFLGHFWWLQSMLKPQVLQCFLIKMHFLGPPQKIRNPICEHNCANWKTNWGVFLQFCFGGLLLCPVFALFWKEWKNKIQNKTTKTNKTTRCTQ